MERRSAQNMREKIPGPKPALGRNQAAKRWSRLPPPVPGGWYKKNCKRFQKHQSDRRMERGPRAAKAGAAAGGQAGEAADGLSGEKNGCPAEADSRADVSGFAGWPGPAAVRFQDCHDVYGMMGKEAGKRAGREMENGGGEKADK